MKKIKVSIQDENTLVLLEDASKSDNVVDDHYNKLNCKIKPLDKSVNKYLYVLNFFQDKRIWNY